MEQEKRGRGRPATGVTPKRNIRVGEIWDEAEAIAKDRGENMAQLVTRLLHTWVAENRPTEADAG